MHDSSSATSSSVDFHLPPPSPSKKDSNTTTTTTLRPASRTKKHFQSSLGASSSASSDSDDATHSAASRSRDTHFGRGSKDFHIPAHIDDSALFQHEPSRLAPIVKEPHSEAGLQPDEVYKRNLPRWRYILRRLLVNQLERETPWMAEVQNRIRTPLLDAYFYWTAIFGTHTFFMTVLPMFFWFGNHDQGRGLLYVTGLGIYVSSYAKDLACTPRPFSPPVIRLSMSTHGQEYGFPSSHSTNSVSTALFLSGWVLSNSDSFGTWGTTICQMLLVCYASSVIAGRMYCGMHSVIDCLAGGAMGWGCWYTWELLRDRVNGWVVTGHWSVPVVCTIICLFLVNKHPEPVDDCPCFEDAIAMLAVMLGSFFTHWCHAKGLVLPDFAPEGLTPFGVESTWTIPAWSLFIIFKMIVGITVIFTWRLAAKQLLRVILPPIFRAVSTALDFELPTRKHYKAATDYGAVPGPYSLNPVPSFINLPDQNIITSEPEIRLDSPSSLLHPSSINGRVSDNISTKVKKQHYDVEVLTKVIVYAGIGIFSIMICPLILSVLDRHILA